MPELCNELLFIRKITVVFVGTGCGMLEVEVSADGPEPLVEGLSSDQFLLEKGLYSSSASDILPERSSNKSHRPEVLDHARDAAKWPQASFSSWAALTLSVAASCSMNKKLKIDVLVMS